MKILYNQTLLDKLLGIRRVGDMVRIPKNSRIILPKKNTGNIEYTNTKELVIRKDDIEKIQEGL
jgi:hypothetical protein